MPAIPASVWEQIPVVAIFAILAYFAFREFKATLKEVVNEQQRFFAEQRKQDREILTALVDEVHGVRTDLHDHDQLTRDAVARMEERTRPRGEVTKTSRARTRKDQE